MDINTRYLEILDKLKKDERPLLKLTSEELDFLNHSWSELFKAQEISHESLFKILCILDNTISLSTIFSQNILKTLVLDSKNKDNEQIVVLTLGITRKHIIEAYHKESRRIPIEVLDTFKTLLHAKSGEIREWVLRNIESLGSQSAYLRKEVLESRPGLLQLFNKHNQACVQIIELLEKRWSAFK